MWRFGGAYDQTPAGITAKDDETALAELLGLLGIGYRGHAGFELRHPLPVVEGRTVGVNCVDKNARLAAECMRGIRAQARKRHTRRVNVRYNRSMVSRRGIIAALLGSGIHSRSLEGQMFGNAEAYERFMGRWSRLLAPLLIDFASPAQTGQLLDVGSGTGALTFALAAKRPRCRIVGIDPSRDYVEFATGRNPFPQRVRFLAADAQQLNFPAATFQAALSLLVFNFIPDSRKALGEVSRVTRPGGCVSAAVWDYGAEMRMLRVFWDAAAVVDPSSGRADELNMRLCREGELSQLWKDGGLERVEERALKIQMRFESFSGYWDPFLLGQGPAGAYVRGLDSIRREALRQELKRRLAPDTEAAPFTLDSRAWAVRGFVPLR